MKPISYPTVAKIEWFDDVDKETRTEYIFIYATTYSDAAAQIEDYYGETLIEMTIHQYEGPQFFSLSEKQYDAVKSIIERL